jgi:putative PIN family toxin of toxin-antitoxin system
MAAKKKRIPVVLDTNVFIRAFLSRSKSSPNKRIFRFWLLERKLQLIVSPEIVAEYLETFQDVLGFGEELLADWRTRFEKDGRSMLVRHSKRFHESRDPDDNLMLATAHAGKAEYLVTNDNDLLDLPAELQASLPFRICPPAEFLKIHDDPARG